MSSGPSWNGIGQSRPLEQGLAPIFLGSTPIFFSGLPFFSNGRSFSNVYIAIMIGPAPRAILFDNEPR